MQVPFPAPSTFSACAVNIRIHNLLDDAARRSTFALSKSSSTTQPQGVHSPAPCKSHSPLPRRSTLALAHPQPPRQCNNKAFIRLLPCKSHSPLPRRLVLAPSNSVSTTSSTMQQQGVHSPVPHMQVPFPAPSTFGACAVNIRIHNLLDDAATRCLFASQVLFPTPYSLTFDTCIVNVHLFSLPMPGHSAFGSSPGHPTFASSFGSQSLCLPFITSIWGFSSPTPGVQCSLHQL
ncbi:hypothetical protein JAAARDRAFT_198555 [Jaapia argillacea MUCL 33604]|uniref:Uncharacterized protein n=1 Tax=Jaapia argillacea MUCL 33604 TaxID=933084 RepID=A0A067PE79_9AGAM|nr:hypothetical protein JAAARDRAFT_198555 [Jaapia argillacea MUCL 33604]